MGTVRGRAGDDGWDRFIDRRGDSHIFREDCKLRAGGIMPGGFRQLLCCPGPKAPLLLIFFC
jgi:hypothetical protein